MMLRSGKKYNYPSNQPFKLILLPEKINYPNNIDFDDASKEWRKNKIYMGEGMFEYKSKKNGP